MNIIDYGTRSGGGIGDIFPKVSLKMNPSIFIYKFIYSVIFHVFIVLILGNIFLGIIVDTFKSLREKHQIRKNDINNNCFICNISKESISNDEKDFKKHQKVVHNIFYYFYFVSSITHKSIYELNRFENYSIKSIAKGKTQWLPEPKENQ
jgi:hypothetical protein